MKDINKIIRSYEIHIKPTLGHINVDKIDAEIVKKLQNQKRKVLAERTVNAIIQIIGAIFNVAIYKKLYLKANPLTGQIKRKNVDNKRERYLELDEIKILLNEVQVEPYLYLFVQIALQTGARLSSILSLTKKDINLEQNTITIKDHKNNSTYNGFFNNELKSLLEDRINEIDANGKIVKRGKQVIQDRLRKNF